MSLAHIAVSVFFTVVLVSCIVAIFQILKGEW